MPPRSGTAPVSDPDTGPTSVGSGESAPGGEDLDDESGADVVDGPSYEPMSVRGAALIVLGLAVFILIGGVVASALASGSNPTFAIRRVTLPDGTVVAISPAATKLRAIENNDEPPADILGNFGVPTQSRVLRVVNSDQGDGQFDRTASLDSQLTSGNVIAAWSTMLRLVGWQIIYTGPAPQGVSGSTEVLAKHGSGDGFYWEAGVVASPSTPTGTTPYSVELFETDDGN